MREGRTVEEADVAKGVMGVVDVQSCPDGAGGEAQLLGVEICRFNRRAAREGKRERRTGLPKAMIRAEPRLSSLDIAIRDEKDDILRPHRVLWGPRQLLLRKNDEKTSSLLR